MAQTIFVYSGDEVCAAASVGTVAALACECLTRAISDSPTGARHAVFVERLAADEIVAAISSNFREHPRVGRGKRLIPMDAGAIASYVHYGCVLLLTQDPFAEASVLAGQLGLDEDDILIRIHHAIIQASRIITLGQSARAAVAPFIATPAHHCLLPPIPLNADPQGNGVLVVLHQAHKQFGTRALLELQKEYPAFDFVSAESCNPFGRAWRAAVHIGPAMSTVPGARLVDAWAGEVPVLQLADLAQTRSSLPGGEPETVEHGKSGFLCSTLPDLVLAFGEILSDTVVARVITRMARNGRDYTDDWIGVAGELLQ